MDIQALSTAASMISGASGAQARVDLNDDINKTNSFQDALKRAAEEQDDVKLKNACEEFEAYFIQTMFKEMRKTVDTSKSYIPMTNADNIYRDMLDEEYSKNAAKSGGIGLAAMMYKQMKQEGITEFPSLS
ncbi:hypothetical protein FACS1894188_01990 [Clostridia bacterium]|nr:hypothetical protein FACS1894188_01990 [Clostridia bacterium]